MKDEGYDYAIINSVLETVKINAKITMSNEWKFQETPWGEDGVVWDNQDTEKGAEYFSRITVTQSPVKNH